MNTNKRGQSSTIGVIIAIILGVVLVVFLIWGFSTNWSMFRGTTGPYVGQSNIDSIRDACNLQCQGLEDRWCNEEKTVIYRDGTTERLTCNNLVKAGTITGLQGCYECEEEVTEENDDE